MSNKISVFLPTRAGSERIANKNTRTFANIQGGLLTIKIEQLLNTKAVSEIILSSNDTDSLQIGRRYSMNSNKIKVIERPEHLALSSTSLTDLIEHAANTVSFSHILWTHVTSPFVGTDDYTDAINIYFERTKHDYDSLMSVHKIQNFLWSEKKSSVVNTFNHKVKWPRTQDLEPLYEVNSAVFLASQKVYREQNDRIGKTPYLLEQSLIKSLDIDWDEDFVLAEKLFLHGFK